MDFKTFYLSIHPKKQKILNVQSIDNDMSNMLYFLRVILNTEIKPDVPKYKLSTRVEEYKLLCTDKNFESLFFQTFRLTQRTFQRLVVAIEDGNLHQGSYPLCLQLMIVLRHCATGNSYHSLSREFDVPLSTIAKTVVKMAKIILRMKKHFIKLPLCLNESHECSQHFAIKIGHPNFNMVAGCLDGTLVQIKRPKSRKCPNAYRDRHSNHSINVQAICNHRKEFIYVQAGYPGSCHDSFVWKNSECYKKKLFPPPGYCLLADSGYFLCDHPLTIVPYKRMQGNFALKVEERRFNEALKTARKYIEMAFGILKNRWRIMQKEIESDLKTANDLIVVCFILHNLCLQTNDDFECADSHVSQTDYEDTEEGNEETPFNNSEANRLRIRLTNSLSCTEVFPRSLNDHQYFSN